MPKGQLALIVRWAEPPRDAFVCRLRLSAVPSPGRALARRLA